MGRKKGSLNKKGKGAQDSQSRAWFLTINNPSKEEQDVYATSNKADFSSLIVYCKYAHETGGDRATPHMHIYLHLSRNERFSAIKKAFPRADIEEPIGTPRQQIDYIGNPAFIYSPKHPDKNKAGKPKGGTVEWVKEWGDITRIKLDRKTSDSEARLAALKEMIDAGSNELSLYNEDFLIMCRYGASLRHYAELHRLTINMEKNIILVKEIEHTT